MVGVGSSDIDDVDRGIGNKLCVGAIRFSSGGCFDVFEEGLGAGCRGRGCCCCNDVLNVIDTAGSRVGEEVFGER